MLNDQRLAKHYDALTPKERVRLALAAAARGDSEEIVRLRTRCPTGTITGPDPRIMLLCARILLETYGVYLLWTEVSYYVILSRVPEAFAARAGRRTADPRSPNPGRGNGDMEGEDPENRDVAGEPAQQWSALWKGVESGVMRFCTEIGLSKDEWFALVC